MGTEMIKDDKGKAHLALTNEDFYNDDIMGDKFDDYDILEFGERGKEEEKDNEKKQEKAKQILEEFVQNLILKHMQ